MQLIRIHISLIALQSRCNSLVYSCTCISVWDLVNSKVFILLIWCFFNVHPLHAVIALNANEDCYLNRFWKTQYRHQLYQLNSHVLARKLNGESSGKIWFKVSRRTHKGFRGGRLNHSAISGRKHRLLCVTPCRSFSYQGDHSPVSVLALHYFLNIFSHSLLADLYESISSINRNCWHWSWNMQLT